MRLNEKEYYKYLDIHPKLIYYIGKKKKLIPAGTSLEDFIAYEVQAKLPIRNAMYENIHLLDNYLKDNAGYLSAEDEEIIKNFKYYKKGTFYVVKLTKKHAHFLGDTYVYGVHALNDPFELFWGNNLPVMVEATLLPYKGKIIYDGIISGYPLHFGRGARAGIKNSYTIAEGKYGIITELPEKIDKDKSSNKVEGELIAMMKTKASRAYNAYEIEELLKKHPKLASVYTKEWGRINARNKRKEIKGLGIKKRWFAMYNDTILVSGKTEKEVQIKINELITESEKRAGVYYFKI